MPLSPLKSARILGSRFLHARVKRVVEAAPCPHSQSTLRVGHSVSEPVEGLEGVIRDQNREAAVGAGRDPPAPCCATRHRWWFLVFVFVLKKRIETNVFSRVTKMNVETNHGGTADTEKTHWTGAHDRIRLLRYGMMSL